MKKTYIILLIIVSLIISSCQATPTPLDPTSIQNTAVAFAWTSVAKTAVRQDKLTAFSAQTLTKVAAPTFTPRPTLSPNGNFEMSWDIYSSEYNSLGGILTIRKQGSKYTQTLLMSDGSGETGSLTMKVVNGEERLHDDRFDDYYGDYMLIGKDGYLNFYDNQGFIYRVPPLK